jgi:hypothetical protein
MLLNMHYFGKPVLEEADDLTAELAAPTPMPAPRIDGAYTVDQAGGQGIKGVGMGLYNVGNSLVRNVFDTVKFAGQAGLGVAVKDFENKSGFNLNDPLGSESAIEGVGKLATNPSILVDHYKQRYGSSDAVLKTIFEDPAAFMSDLTVAAQGVGLAAKGAQLTAKAAGASNLASKLGTVSSQLSAANLIDPIEQTIKAGAIGTGKIAKVAAKPLAGAAGFAVRQATGLSDDTVRYIAKHSDFDAGASPELKRLSIGQKFQSKLDEFEQAEAGLLPEYKAVRESADPVSLVRNPLIEKLKEKGFQIEQGKEGIRLVKSIDSKLPLSKGELGQIEEVLNLLSGRKIITPDQFLNVRGELTKLSKFDAAAPLGKDVRTLGRDLRKAWNSLRPQINGIEQIDNRFSSVADDLDEFSDGFARNAEGKLGLTETGYKRLLNLTNRGNDRLLQQVKKYIPDIEDDVRALRALEDVLNAADHKVGTYSRSILGVGAGAAIGGIPGAIAGLLLSSPTVTIPLIKAYGKVTGVAGDVVNGIINKIKTGGKLTPDQSNQVREAIKYFDELNDELTSMAPPVKPETMVSAMDNLDDVPLSQLSPQGVADAAASQKVLDAGGTLDDAMNSFPSK